MPGPRFDFYPNGFENTPHPCLVMDDPQGGDPHILGLFSVLYRPADIIGLVQMANSYLAGIEGEEIGKVIGKAELETHIDRECAVLGHEWATDHENDPPTCLHCGVAAG